MSENTQEAAATAEKKMKISARVYRAATGEWEEIGIIAESDDKITAPELEDFIGRLKEAGAENSIIKQLTGVLNKLKGD